MKIVKTRLKNITRDNFIDFCMDLSKDNIRTIIYYCWMRGLSPAACESEINNTLGKGTISLNTVKRWMNSYVEGNFDTKDKERSGRSSLDIEGEIQQLLHDNKHITTRDIAQELGISNSTAHSHLVKMGKQYLMNVWVPHLLQPQHKQKRVEICQQLLQMLHRNNFLRQIVTCDEVCIYWENEGRGGLNRSWRGEGDTPATVPLRNKMTTKKHLASVFWDAKGILLVEVLPPNQAIG